MWRRRCTFPFVDGNRIAQDQDSDQSISEEEEGLEVGTNGILISSDGVEGRKVRRRCPIYGFVYCSGELLDFDGDMWRCKFSLNLTYSEVFEVFPYCHFLNKTPNPAAKYVICFNENAADSYKENCSENCILSDTGKEECSYDDIENPMFDDTNGSQDIPAATYSVKIFSNREEIHLPAVASVSSSDEIRPGNEYDRRIKTSSLPSSRKRIGLTWSVASLEAESLVRLNEMSKYSSVYSAYVIDKQLYQDVEAMGKSKSKLPFSNHPIEKGPSLFGNGIPEITAEQDEIPDDLDEDDGKFSDASRTMLHPKDTLQPEDSKELPEPSHKHYLKEHSMSEFLDCFRKGSNTLIPGSSEIAGDLDVDLQDAVESGSSSPADDEDKLHVLNATVPVKSMGDQFHEAFGTMVFGSERSCSGIHGQLQQVIQNEKDRDIEFLKYLGTLTGSKDKEMCVLVRIISKSLEARLIVCYCTYCGDGNELHNEYNNSQIKTKGAQPRALCVIFNTRLCNNVELDIGNVIRIFHPWKEVYVKEKDEVVYLCSYFSQVHCSEV